MPITAPITRARRILVCSFMPFPECAIGSAIDALCRGWGSATPEQRMPVPVGEIENDAGGHPEAKSLPRAHGQPLHDEHAGSSADDRYDPQTPHAERPWPLWLLDTQHEDAHAYNREGEEGPDVRGVVDLVLIEHEAADGDHEARYDRRDVRCPVLRMNLRCELRQQAVTRHREEDARLAILEDEQHRRQ